MKKAKLFAAILTAVLFVAACSNAKPADTPKEDVVAEQEVCDLGSLEELNEVLGSSLCGPAAMGVKDIAYTVIGEGEDQVASYTFAIGAYTYEFRATRSASEDVITGVSEEGDTEYPNANDEIAWKTTENYKLAWWLGADELSYAVVVEDQGKMSMEEFQGTVDELCSLAK